MDALSRLIARELAELAAPHELNEWEELARRQRLAGLQLAASLRPPSKEPPRPDDRGGSEEESPRGR